MQNQALSDQYKDAVRSWVPKVRKVLEADLEVQLERLGIRSTGKPVPLDKMHLSDDARATRIRVEALLTRDAQVEGSQARGYENVLREFTYTFLNRLVGLKSMEARRLLCLPVPGRETESPEETEVITPIPGQARSRYLRDFRAASGSRYKYEEDAEEALLRDGLTAVFCHITSEIRLLFDPDHEYSSVWPTHACLVKVVGMINNDLPEDAYRAQDFLGWVYQFFNRDEKKKVRDRNKGTPRSSYELAVMNQFYTPSWIVKALVDNTLGRLWLQMHPDSGLKAESPPPLPEERASDEPVADYLVPRTGEKIRYRRVTDFGGVEDFKRARDIALLDPACGTMHFGQYAFGLFYKMYVDEIEHAGEPGWPKEPSVTEQEKIPLAIVENNLFGIDIDPRAIQIASLSLLLTAKETALKNGYSPLNVHIKRTNLVVANAVDLGEDRLEALVSRVGARLGSSKIQTRLFKTIWDNLQYVGELGSLIQVREGVKRLLDEWVEEQARAKGVSRVLASKEKPQLDLGTILTDADRKRARQMELERRLLEEEAEQLRIELLEGVEAAASEDGTDPTQHLFAEDTARGLKLLELLSRRYDVVVMNPPYGKFVPRVKEFVKAVYPVTSNDIYAAFIDRAIQLLEHGGYVGALVPSTFKANARFLLFRTEVLLRRSPLTLMLELGKSILDDATNETAAIVLRDTA